MKQSSKSRDIFVDTVEIKGMRFECIVGLFSHERIQKQILEVDLCIFTDVRKAASTDKIRYALDYGQIYGVVNFILASGNFKLLETAAEAIARYTLSLNMSSARNLLQKVKVSIKKPQAFGNNGVALISVNRAVDDYNFTKEITSFGSVDILFETQKYGFYQLNIKPGGKIPPHSHKMLDEYEMSLSLGLISQGKVVNPGFLRQWPKNFVHYYSNPTQIDTSILCVNHPKFNPADEVYLDRDEKSITQDVEHKQMFPEGYSFKEINS